MHVIGQGYSNGPLQSESGPLDGDDRTSRILYAEVLSQNFALLAILKH